MKLKYYYIYSDEYEFWNKKIQTELNSHFDLKPLKIGKIERNKSSNHFHAFASTRNTIKIDLVCSSIRENMGNTIIFSDANFCINNRLIAKYKNYLHQLTKTSIDIILANNRCGTPNNFKTEDYNIGLLLIKCNSKTLKFFEKVICDIKTSDSGWDQVSVNYLLKNQINDENSITFDTFDKKYVWSSYLEIFEDKYPKCYGNYIDNLFALKLWHKPNKNNSVVTNVKWRTDKYIQLGLVNNDN